MTQAPILAPSVVKESLITAEVKAKIYRIISVFETGSKYPQYDSLTVLNDARINENGFFDSNGKIKSTQKTFGAYQTTEQYNLKKLIQVYIDHKGRYASDFSDYMPILGLKPIKDPTFSELLKKSGSDPVMGLSQDIFFEIEYFKPAYKWFLDNGFTLPLSLAVIFDSFIHSGRIRDNIRNMFPEQTPANGGDEKIWIIQYTQARENWLKSGGELLSKTTYRQDAFQKEFFENDWTMQTPFNANGVII